MAQMQQTPFILNFVDFLKHVFLDFLSDLRTISKNYESLFLYISAVKYFFRWGDRLSSSYHYSESQSFI